MHYTRVSELYQHRSEKKVVMHSEVCYNSCIHVSINNFPLMRKENQTMNKEDLILQKLESMDIELKMVRYDFS